MKIEILMDCFNKLWLSYAEDIKIRHKEDNIQIKKMTKTDYINNIIKTDDCSLLANHL